MSVDRRWTSPLAGAIGSASRCPCRGDIGSRTHPGGQPAGTSPPVPAPHSPRHACSTQKAKALQTRHRRQRAVRPTEPIEVLGVAGQYAKLGGLVTQPYDADYWRQRANDARALAEAMTLPMARRVLEHIAATYERLANRAECLAGRKGTRERS